MSDTAYTAPRLTDLEITQYRTEGYVQVHRPILAPAPFAELKAIFEEDLQKFSERELDMIHTRDARLLPFLLSDAVLDLVEPVVGPNIGLWASHLISKEPLTGKATPWHEDSAYWKGRTSTMEGICTVWLAIDRATPENGSMAVIPGSHRNGFSAYEAVEDAKRNLFGSKIRADQFDENRAVYFSLQPNECSLHEGRIIHGAHANTSPHRRAGYTMRYFPLTTQIFHDNPSNANHKIWLARGTDQAGNRYENA